MVLWLAVGVTRSLYLKELYVAEAYRRKGIGRLLMRNLRQVADEHECSRVEWTADEGNPLAEGFTNSLAYRRTGDKVLYRVEDEYLRKWYRPTDLLLK